jgi:hypothetical protein
MVYMENTSAGKIRGCNEKPVTQIFVDEADDDVEVAAFLQEVLEDRIVFRRPVRNRGNQILDDISCERKFGEHNKISFFPFGLLDVIKMFFEIGFDIPKPWGNLC